MVDLKSGVFQSFFSQVEKYFILCLRFLYLCEGKKKTDMFGFSLSISNFIQNGHKMCIKNV